MWRQIRKGLVSRPDSYIYPLTEKMLSRRLDTFVFLRLAFGCMKCPRVAGQRHKAPTKRGCEGKDLLTCTESLTPDHAIVTSFW